MARKKSEAFDLDLDLTERKQLAMDLCTEIEDAWTARSAMIADGGLIDLFDWFYEQGRTDPRDLPFPGAADLTSYFITENVDALSARLMKAVFGVKPFCFVEGWGQDALKAPGVEAFMDWQVRKSTLRADLAKVVQGGLIEDAYILEVSEKIDTQRRTETLDIAIELDPQTQAPLFADGQAKLQMDAQGEPVRAQEGQPSASVQRTHTKTKRLGPQYDPISMKEFVFLPGHAKSSRYVWGYAYRYWARVPELLEQVMDGIFDKDAVDKLGEQTDRLGTTSSTTSVSPSADVAPQTGPASEKELFQVSLKRDLDGDGREEWYLATVSRVHRELLRLKLDRFVMKVGRPRCVPFIFFPRRNSVYGYSYAGDKLLTLAEEHTALRNMKADRSALVTNAPIKVRQGALWDPDAQPFGVGRTIPVRDMDEVQPFEIPDVPNSVVEQEQGLLMAKERVGGLSDVSAIGTRARQSNTLGQDEMISRASAVRVDAVIGHLHESIASVMMLSHAIWVETLKADPNGLEAPRAMATELQLPNGKFTGAMLEGDFQFEPYGSDDTADPNQRQAAFNNKFLALANLGKVFPGIQAMFQRPEAAEAIVEEWARAYDVRDRQPFLLGAQGPPQGQMAASGAPQPGGDHLQSLIAMLHGGHAASPLPGEPADPVALEKLKQHAALAMAAHRDDTLLEKTRMDNERALAVAELGAKTERLSLFLDERKRLGLQEQDAQQAALDKSHDVGMAAVEQAHALQQGDQAHQQATDQATQDAAHQLAIQAAQPKPPATGGSE